MYVRIAEEMAQLLSTLRMVINMYLCLDCDAIFTEPKKYAETHGFLGPPYEEFTGCPCCGGAYTPTYRCDKCGSFIRGRYIKLDEDVYCDACFELYDIGEEP